MLNYVMIMGRLTADPELRKTDSGIEFTGFSVAVQRPKSKGKETETDFFDCVAWGSRANIVCEHYSKGSMILIVGSLRNNRYTDKNGNKRTAAQILVKEVFFTEKKPSNSTIQAEPEFIDIGIDDNVPF